MSLSKEELARLGADFTDHSAENYIAADMALRPELAGMRIYKQPLLAVADAKDPAFGELRRPTAVGAHFSLPEEWLPGARSVISFFLPFTDVVNRANRADPARPADEWLHARIEGQQALEALAARLRKALEQDGAACSLPMSDPRFWSRAQPDGTGHSYTSNWSERHVAYVCGLGTFGLSAGLITAAGMAGRFGSLITTLLLPPDRRPYSRHDEYCTRCGACVRRCPASAISVVAGKSHPLCDALVSETKVRFVPRYGCGKCQVGVPCETRIPSAAVR